MLDAIEMLSTTNDTLGVTLVAISDPQSGEIRVKTLYGLFPANQVFGAGQIRNEWSRDWDISGKTLKLSSTQINAFARDFRFNAAEVMDTKQMIALSKACADEARRLILKQSDENKLLDDIASEPTDGIDIYPDESSAQPASEGLTEGNAIEKPRDNIEPHDPRLQKALEVRNRASGWVSSQLGRLLPRVEGNDTQDDNAVLLADDTFEGAFLDLQLCTDELEKTSDTEVEVLDPFGATDTDNLDTPLETNVDKPLATPVQNLDDLEITLQTDMDDLDNMMDSLFDDTPPQAKQNGALADLSETSLGNIIATHAKWKTAVALGKTVLGLKEWDEKNLLS